jgi:hypothetical protein
MVEQLLVSHAKQSALHFLFKGADATQGSKEAGCLFF